MQKGTEVGFKSLITEAEYDRLINQFKGSKFDFQTNHYFDTPRFSLKGYSTSLRVRERDNLEITLKRKKGYSINVNTFPLSQEQFEDMIETGAIPFPEIQNALSPLINGQRVFRFLGLATKRMYLPYKNGILFIDKSDYTFYIDGKTYSGYFDHEIEYIAQSYYQGKKEFVEIISELNIKYTKADKKIKRAYSILKRLR